MSKASFCAICQARRPFHAFDCTLSSVVPNPSGQKAPARQAASASANQGKPVADAVRVSDGDHAEVDGKDSRLGKGFCPTCLARSPFHAVDCPVAETLDTPVEAEQCKPCNAEDDDASATTARSGSTSLTDEDGSWAPEHLDCHDDAWFGWHCHSCGMVVPQPGCDGSYYYSTALRRKIASRVSQYNNQARDGWRVPVPRNLSDGSGVDESKQHTRSSAQMRSKVVAKTVVPQACGSAQQAGHALVSRKASVQSSSRARLNEKHLATGMTHQINTVVATKHDAEQARINATLDRWNFGVPTCPRAFRAL